MDWNDYAEQYRQLDYIADLPPLLNGLLASRSGSLLDVGCGEGRLLGLIRQHYADRWTLTGFEVSEVRGGIAASHGHRVLISADGTVPVEPHTFDVVVSSHVIEHVADDRAYATELARLVRPGGHLYLETPVKLPGAWYFRRNPEAGWVLDPTHVREYRSSEDVNERLISAGLEIVGEDLTQIAFPLGSAEAVVRRLLRLPQVTTRPTGLRAKMVPIPRYRQQAVLARRPK